MLFGLALFSDNSAKNTLRSMVLAHHWIIILFLEAIVNQLS